MIDPDLVFESVRRGYNALSTASNSEIVEYFDDIDPDSVIGHVNNIKGILFEQVYVNQLAQEGVEATIFESTTHPDVDITLFDDGVAVEELQLKATDSVAYIDATLEEHPDIRIVATSEVSAQIDSDMVIDSGIQNEALEGAVEDTLIGDAINPFNPLSVVKLLFGLF